MNNRQQTTLLNESLQWEDHWNLRLPMYQGGDYRVFRMACFRGDLDALAICAQHNAVPTNVSWTELRVGHLKLYDGPKEPLLLIDGNEDVYEVCGFYSSIQGPFGPGDILSLGFSEGKFSTDRFIEAWQQLSDSGYQLHTFMEINNGSMPFPCSSHLLLAMFPTAIDRAHHQSICDVINFLFDKGLRVPYPKVRAWNKGQRQGYYNIERRNKPNILQALPQPTCPPSILQLFLKQVNDEGLTFNWTRSQLYHETGLEEFSDFVAIVFDDIFAPWTYKAEGACSMGDDLEAKIGLLTEYRDTNAFELYMLRDILGALRKIEARKESQGGLDFERDGVWCWYQLCMAVSYIADEDVRRRTVDLQFSSPEDSQMIQPYLRPSWYAPDCLAWARRVELIIRAAMSGQDSSEYLEAASLVLIE
ncbi:uncharacterized protein BKA55DRAFT_701233 [Fusarium redolens]|uniref:Uncharacterized protein n=1 Tax=Fusarium redolens TaxID=48865 RepID=A0A9P9R8Y5_FUSRE|nr:uncharacterized protein BKA55DRAFT_701233 [Fusarium redolens]KAH7270741.1 hypothetical protein BKA55DRAFT_701233 [Fusarium redolens]